MAAGVTISEAIKQLRAQLEDAQNEGQGKSLRFLARSVEVELGIVFKTEMEGGVAVKAWVLDISGKGKSADEVTHKVKLVLEPVDRDGKPTLVGDTDHEQDEPAHPD